MVDVKCLSDQELQGELKKLGFSPGPILPSTRKVYENKLIQLLVSTPYLPPVMDGPQESNANEEFNTTIVLKGNITLSTEKSKGPKKNPVFEIQEQPEGIMNPNYGYNDFKMIIKRPEAALIKPKALDCYGLDSKTCKGVRCTTRSSNTREESIINEQDFFKSQNPEGLPVTVTFAVLAIFIIVVFIYITVERKPLFG